MIIYNNNDMIVIRLIVIIVIVVYTYVLYNFYNIYTHVYIYIGFTWECQGIQFKQ